MAATPDRLVRQPLLPAFDLAGLLREAAFARILRDRQPVATVDLASAVGTSVPLVTSALDSFVAACSMDRDEDGSMCCTIRNHPPQSAAATTTIRNVSQRCAEMSPENATTRSGARRRLLASVLGTSLVLAGCAGSASPSPSGPVASGPAGTPGGDLTTLRFSYDWSPDSDWAAIVWAQELGYFEEAGVEVEYFPATRH